MSARGVDRTVLVAMAREEWRLHARLFGGRRFVGFPLFVLAACAVAAWALATTGTSLVAVVAGLHALLFGFGLYTGSVGLVGRDAIRDLLGESTLVLFSARTLPVSRRRLLGLFVLKDAAFYAVLFVLPVALAFVPVDVALDATVSVGRLAVSLTATFLLGLSTTLAVIAATSRGRAGRGALLVAAGLVGLAWVAGVPLLAYSPYALYATPSAGAGVATTFAVLGLAAVGVLGFDPHVVAAERRHDDRFGWLVARLPGEETGLMAKTVLDVARSTGGLWKLPFSAGLVFAVTAFLVGVVQRVTGVAPSAGVAFGGLLGLTGFTTYNWLTQFDDRGEYAVLPLATRAVFEAKFRVFSLLALPTAAAFYLVALAWWGTRPAEAAVGFLLLVGVALYLFGVTVLLAGLQPNEFLFDTVLFAAFWLALSAPLVPVLVVGFVLVPVPVSALVGLAVLAVVLGGVGVALARTAPGRWERRYRAG